MTQTEARGQVCVRLSYFLTKLSSAHPTFDHRRPKLHHTRTINVQKNNQYRLVLSDGTLSVSKPDTLLISEDTHTLDIGAHLPWLQNKIRMTT